MMPKLNVYLNFAGNAEEAFNFYRSVFGKEFKSVERFMDIPVEGVDIPEKDQNKIMHISLPIGNEDLLMASDSLESLGQKLSIGNNVYISVHAESKEEADRIFTALSEGGTVEMPISYQPWGYYYGSFADKFGVMWMINFSEQDRK
jgi:PhnB protein